MSITSEIDSMLEEAKQVVRRLGGDPDEVLRRHKRKKAVALQERHRTETHLERIQESLTPEQLTFTPPAPTSKTPTALPDFLAALRRSQPSPASATTSLLEELRGRHAPAGPNPFAPDPDGTRDFLTSIR